MSGRLARVAVLLALVAWGACASNQGTVGAVLAQKPDGRLFVHEAPKGLAAEKAGLREGDEILLVDGTDVRGMDQRTLHAALAGEVGTRVKLTVLRGEDIVRVTLERTPAKRLTLERR